MLSLNCQALFMPFVLDFSALCVKSLLPTVCI
jgi:hypothetical protein